MQGKPMTQTPNLGSTPEEALKSAYCLGYEAFEHTAVRHLLDPDDFEQPLDEVLEERDVSEFEGIRVTISESDANRRLWWALEDFYEEHLPDQYDQFKREAAVAEDYDTAFHAGAYAALSDEEYDPEGDLPFLKTD